MTRIRIYIIICFCFFSVIIRSQEQIKTEADTVNKTDEKGKKQGYWIIYGESKPGTCYKPGQIIEKGYYKHNRKTGQWKEYYCNGNFRSVLTFSDGIPYGLQQTYYDNGQIKEVGFWKNNKWDGVYKMFDIDGKEIRDSTKFYKYDRVRNK